MADATKHGVKLTAKRRKLLQGELCDTHEDAAPVLKKIHKPGKAKPDPIHGLFEAEVNGKPCVVEYEPDTALRDSEQIPLLENGGIETFFRREVLPYTLDLPAPRPRYGRFCVYVLKCSDDSFYIGQTESFPGRLKQHENGEVSWTAPRWPVEPIHWEIFKNRDETVKRESDLKTGYSRQWLKREYEAGRLKAAASRQAGAWIDLAKTQIGYDLLHPSFLPTGTHAHPG